MKLSELFRTPFKVKGGGVLNLRGFSKTVVDKEIGGNSETSDDIDVFAKYGCVNVVHTEFNPDPVETYIKLVVGDRNKRVTITPDDFIKYQAEVQNLINNHQEAGDLSSYILAEEQVSMKGSNFIVRIFDLIPSSLSNIKIDTAIVGATQGSHQYSVPDMPEFVAENDIMNISNGKVPNGLEIFGNISSINLHGLCLIAFINYFGIEKPQEFSMPALYIDIDDTPSEDYKIPAKFVWVTIKAVI